MRRCKGLILAGLLLYLFSTVVTSGLADPPPIPSSFYGTVKVNGSNVPLTTNISARINGVLYAESDVVIYTGDTVYSLNIPGDINGTPEIEGGRPGDTIIFYIGNQAADQTGIWQSGTNIQLNLSYISSPPQDGAQKLFLPIILHK